MPLISQPIPNLIGGISQQPPVFRRNNQCSDSLNTYNDPVTGVSKRPGSQHIGDLSGNLTGYFGEIERDELEKYIFLMSSTGIRVWDSTGVERTVTAPSGYGYLSSSTQYRYLTIADTTFIVNPQITVQKTSNTTPSSTADGLIFIRAVDYNLKYTVDIDGVGAVPATYTTPASGTISTEQVASSLSSQLNSSANITAESRGPVVKYTVNGSGFNVRAFSSLGDDFITAIPGVVENFGDLPVIGYDGVIVRVNQNPTTDADDYYVRFEGEGNGIWIETVAPDISFELDPATMPHILVRESDGTFTFKEFTWKGRATGDESSNPDPSFVGESIANIFFERNRLGFLSDINCILSESADIANFFRTTVSTIVDSDVIDLSVSGRQVDKLKTAIGVKDGILLFSEEAQMLLNVGDADILSPETASITSVSSYQSNTNVEPERVGDSILFVTRRDNQSGVREYLYESGRDFTQSASITNHVPQLLPQSLERITGSSTENIVFFQPEASKELFVYQYLYSGAEKIVSAWTRWRFNSSDILFVTVFDDYLYVVLDRGDQTTLERIPLSNSFTLDNLTNEICLDSYSFSEGASRSIQGPNTVFTLDRLFSSPELVLVAASDLPAEDIYSGDVLTPLSITPSGNTTLIEFEGDYTTIDFYIGTTYVFLYEFSRPHLNLGEGRQDTSGRMQVRNVEVYLVETGDCQFRVVYEEQGQSTSDVVFIADVEDWSALEDMQTLSAFDINGIGGEIYQLSRVFPDAELSTRLNSVTYNYRVPVMSVNTGYRLIVESDGWQPVTLASAQVEAMYHKRSRTNG